VVSPVLSGGRARGGGGAARQKQRGSHLLV
jgi:hypothetical protein